MSHGCVPLGADRGGAGGDAAHLPTVRHNPLALCTTVPGVEGEVLMVNCAAGELQLVKVPVPPPCWGSDCRER
eukprot:COSAG02_NODE_4554_length_5220_cov_31.069713_6_plen_73_part_00